MPPVVAAIPIIASVAVAVLKVSAIVKALIVVAAMVATTLLTRKPKASANRIQQGAELSTKISPSLPRTICIGLTAIGPSCHFAFTYTDDPDKPNRYLVRVYQISDQPINNLSAIYDGKTTLTFPGDITTGWFPCNQHKNAKGDPCMWMRVYKGVFSGAVADASVISWSGGDWTSSHKGTGISYAIVKYDYDADAFPNGEPELVFAVEGAKVYDDRADSTVPGGSGPQRLASPTTWAYTDNVAVNIAQYLRGFTINSKRIMGVGADARDLSSAMLFSAYNTCDQNVNHNTGAYKRYACGMNLASDETAESHLSDLMLAMDGKIFDRGGAITLWPGAIRTPVMDVGVQDIDWTAEKSWQPRAGLDALVNYVSGNFVDKDKFFQERDIPPRRNTTWEANDGGQRFGTFVSMRAVNRWSQAQRIAHRIHQASRFGGTVAFIGGIWLMEMEQGDWFTLTVPRWGMSSKLFEIIEITLTTDMRVAIVAQEVSNSFDSWDPALNEFDRTDDTWTSPLYTLPIPTFTLEAYSFYNEASGVQDFGITFKLLTPTQLTGSYVKGVEIQYAETADLANPESMGTIRLDEVNKTVTGLMPGLSYSVRARTTDGDRFGDWSSWVAITTEDPNTEILSSLVSVIDDSILTAVEKSHQLQDIYNDLEARYAPVFSRATTLGLSTTALTNARNDWLALLAGYSPAWNDFTQDTDIYTTALQSEYFPVDPDAGDPIGGTNILANFDLTTWGNAFNTLAGAVVNGDYYTLTDADAVNYAERTHQLVTVGGNPYYMVIRVKKDNVDRTTRALIFGVYDNVDSAFGFLDTKYGRLDRNAYVTDSVVIDEGDSWLCFLQYTAGGPVAILRVLPAASSVGTLWTTGDDIPAGTSPTVTGSTDVAVLGFFAGNIPVTLGADRWTAFNSIRADYVPPYIRVADLNTVSWASFARGFFITPGAGNKYSVGLRIKKDAVGRADRFPAIRIQASGGAAAKICDVVLDTSTGEYASTVDAWDAFGVYDLGTEWFAWGTMTAHADNDGIQVELYPAVGSGATLVSGNYNATETGFIDVRPPLFATGDIWNLGPAALIGREIAYASAISSLQRQINERDSSTAVVIDPIADFVVPSDSLGVPKDLPTDFPITASIGTANVTTLGTWTRTVTSGITCTIGAATGILNVTAMDVDEVLVPVTFVYLGITRTANVHVIKQRDPPTSEGGGGGGGGSDSATTTTLGNTTGTAYDTTNAVSATLTVVAGVSGEIKLQAPISFKRVGLSSINGVTGAWGKWQTKPVGSGSFTDVAAESQNGLVLASTSGGVKNAGAISITQTKTGLTPGASYECRFLWRRTDVSGTAANIFRTSGTLKGTGQ